MIQPRLLIASLLLGLAASKLFTNTILINQFKRSTGWLFLDRMAFDEGDASISFQFSITTEMKPNKNLYLDLAIIPGEIWEEEKAFKCDMPSPNHHSTYIPMVLHPEQGLSSSVRTTLNIKKPTTYNFVLRDCSKTIVNEYFRKQALINVVLNMKNGELEHGSDERSYLVLLPALLIITAAMAYSSKQVTNQVFNSDRDWARLLLFLSLIMNFIALLFAYLGFLIYSNVNGKHYAFFDFMYLLFHSLSQSLLTSLIIFIAYGWTITFFKDAEFDLYIPLICMLGLINLILTLLGKVNDGDSDKYHMYDSIPSYMLVFFRIVTIITLTIGLVNLYLANSKNDRIRKFIITFGILGATYFLSLPVIMILVNWLPPSQRKRVVFFGVQLVKNIINLLILWMISSKKSNYSGIKLSSRSFMQSQNKLL